MATFDTSVCNKALKLLRQDVEISGATGSPIAVKCASLYDIAYDAVAHAHEWASPMTGATPTDSTLLKLLVYSLARELAVAVTGRIQDFEVMATVYARSLEEAKEYDLEEALKVETEADLVEAFSHIRAYFGAGKSLPWGWAAIKRKYNALKDKCRDEILSSRAWHMFMRETSVTSAPAEGGAWKVELPGDVDKMVTAKDELGNDIFYVRRGGTITSEKPIATIVYQSYGDGFTDWSIAMKNAYILRVAQTIAWGMPRETIAQESLRAEYEKVLSDAKLEDAKESRPSTASATRRNRYSSSMVTNRPLREIKVW